MQKLYTKDNFDQHVDSGAYVNHRVEQTSDSAYCEEVQNLHNVNVMEELFAPDFVCHPDLDLTTCKQIVRASIAAFRDVRVTIEAQIADGDMVATRWRSEGTHLGDFEGIPSTGRRASISAMQFDRLRDGKIIEH